MSRTNLYIGFLAAVIALFIFPYHSVAQQAAFKWYTVNDGLPATATTTVYQDRYGYLWVGTGAGASRFDGRQFANYTVYDGLPSLRITVFFQDSYGRFWAGTDIGIARFRSNRFVTYPLSDKGGDIYVASFFETPERKLLAATGRGVYEFADSIWKKAALYPGYQNHRCSGIVKFGGEWYVNYRDGLVYRDANKRWHYLAHAADYGLEFNVLSTFGGRLFVSIGPAVYEIKQHRLTRVYHDASSSFAYFSYLADNNNRLWITHKNYFKVSRPNDWTNFPDSVGGIVAPLFVVSDSGKNVWLGPMEGLLKIRSSGFTIIDRDGNGPLDGMLNVVPDGANGVLLSSGTQKNLLLYNGNQFKPFSAADERTVPPAAPRDVYELAHQKYPDPIDAYTYDGEDSLWLLTRFRRLYKVSGTRLLDYTGSIKTTTREYAYDITYARQRGEFFVCIDSTLLYGRPGSKLIPFIPRNTGEPLALPSRVREVKNGLIILYLKSGGIYAIDKNNDLVSLAKETGVDGVRNNAFLGPWYYDEKSDDLWIGRPGVGLYRFGFGTNKKPFLKDLLRDNDGLQSTNILSLTTDGRDRLWIATNVGIDIVATGRQAKPEIFNLLRQADMSIAVSDLEKLAHDRQGNVWLSSPKKVIRFNTSTISPERSTPRIIIEKIALDFKETEWQKIAGSLDTYFDLPHQPVLKYNQNSLGIFFNAVDISGAISNPLYAYKLLPVDTSWSIPSRNKSVSFTQLPPGKYTFMARTKDAASPWSKAVVFGFTIRPPFWSTWWFRLLVVLLAAFVVVGVFRSRVRKIEADAALKNQLKELEMKALKAQMNPHFIYNALNSIQALVEQDKKSEGIRYIGSFSRLLRQVLENSESNAISLDKELDTIGLYMQLEALRLDVQLKYCKEIAADIVPEFEKLPPLILQPFVENALWHGLSRKEGLKEIRIAVNLADEDWLTCTVTDNGIGRDKAGELKKRSAVMHNSKGIEITRKRLLDFNDNDKPPVEFIDLYDTQNHPTGTTVVLHIRRKSA